MAFFTARATRSPFATAVFIALSFFSACQERPAPERKALRIEMDRALQDRSYETVVTLGRRMVQAWPQDDGGWDRLVRAQIGLRDLAGARQTLLDWQRTVRKPSPKFDERLGDIARHEAQPAAAVQAWSKALAAKPNDIRLLRKLAGAYRAQAQWPEEDAALSMMIEVEESGSARIERALCRRRLHRWSEALDDSRRAQEIAPDDPDVRRGAKLFGRLGPFLALIRELDARLALNADDDQTLTDRALLFLRSEDPELALADAELAAQKAPWAIRPKLFRLLALTELGQLNGSPSAGAEGPLRLTSLTPEFLETISRLDSELSVETKNADLYVARAWQLNEIGQPALALEDAETALRNEAELAGAHAERSYALAKLGRSDEALKAITRTTELNSNLAPGWQYRGELEMARGNFKEAVDAFSRALAIAPTPAGLGKREQCYRELGLVQKADEDRHALEFRSVR